MLAVPGRGAGRIELSAASRAYPEGLPVVATVYIIYMG